MSVVATRDDAVDADLARREAVIERGLSTFLEVGLELTVIREQRLYYQDFETFEDYCHQRWAFSDSRARQMIGAVATVTKVTALGAPAPTSERQARALTGLKPEEAAEVMTRAHEDTAGKVTAKAISEAREQVVPKPPAEPPFKPRDPFANWSQDERDLLVRLQAGQTIVVNMRANAHSSLWSWAESSGLGVRIDRKSDWGNPFLTPSDGTRDQVCDHFADAYFPHKPSLQAKVSNLTGKALGCWCAPARCHGDFLADQANP